MMIFLFILLVIGLIGFIFNRRHRMSLIEKQKNIIDQYLYRLRHFIAFKQYVGMDGCSGIAIDKNRKQICLVNNKNGIVKGKIIVYKDLVSSEIVEDGKNIALHIVTRDIEQPKHIVNFIDIQIKEDNSLYKIAIAQAQYWYNLMSTIINQVQEDEKLSKKSITETPAVSVTH